MGNNEMIVFILYGIRSLHYSLLFAESAFLLFLVSLWNSCSVTVAKSVRHANIYIIMFTMTSIIRDAYIREVCK